jgi:hypothetical protein
MAILPGLGLFCEKLRRHKEGLGLLVKIDRATIIVDQTEN